MKKKNNELFTEKEFKAWLKLHAKRVKEIRNEKDLKRMENLLHLNYPSYSQLSEIESFKEGITLRSFYLVLKLLKVSAFEFFNTPDFRDSND